MHERRPSPPIRVGSCAWIHLEPSRPCPSTAEAVPLTTSSTICSCSVISNEQLRIRCVTSQKPEHCLSRTRAACLSSMPAIRRALSCSLLTFCVTKFRTCVIDPKGEPRKSPLKRGLPMPSNPQPDGSSTGFSCKTYVWHLAGLRHSPIFADSLSRVRRA